MGYVLPFGNMSYWGAQVIINIFGTIPGIGPDLVEWIRGDYGIADATLNRFFSLHVVALPFIIALLIAAAPGGAAPGRLEQSGRHRDQGEARARTASRSTASRSIRTTRSRTSSASACSSRCSPSWCSSCRPSADCSSSAELRAGQPDVDAGAHRAGVVLHALLRDPARDPGPADRRAADGAARCWPSCSCRGSIARKNKSIRYRGLASKILLGTFFVTFLVLMWLGLQARRSPVRDCWPASARRCTSHSSSCCRSSPRPTATARFRKE